MIIFPAMDIRNGQCVRLAQGDFNKQTRYNADPMEIAMSYKAQGATYLHVVDLDGAKSGYPSNLDLILSLRQKVGLPIQMGGGLRDEKTISKVLDQGIDRIILSTLAIEEPDLLKRLFGRYPDRIMVSLDAKNGYVTTQGWQHTTDLKAVDYCRVLYNLGLRMIVYTDIAKDGMLMGPNFDDYDNLIKDTPMKVIASGGISTIDDLKRLQSMNVYGAIIGKAIYEKKIDLKEAIQCSQNASSHA